jgi:hypothetical protein
MRKMKFKIVIASILIFLIITNPSLKTFKDYVNTDARRNYNFILFSIYQHIEYDRSGYGSYTYYYLGIAENFFNLNVK